MANIMILGSGGREHALSWWFKQYEHKVFTAPGNAGTESIGTNIPIDINNFNSIADSASQYNIDLVFVGPEKPLVCGISDFWKEKGPTGTHIFAPSKESSMLEGSKIEARKFAKKYGIKIPKFKAFETDNYHINTKEAKDYLKQKKDPLLVVKADGLCCGKGVIVNESIEDTLRAIDQLSQFGTASKKFLLEEKLSGEEASITIITDGNSYKMFHHSQDHKRRFDKNIGPNTGGMGAYAPTKLITPDLEERIKKEIIEPTISGINQENIQYKGILYIAIMMHQGNPYLIEYNCRFGDPEAQAIIPLASSDPYELMVNCINGELENSSFKLKNQYSACVMLVTKKYPEEISANEEITIHQKLESMEDALLFHSGTKYENNKTVTNGGRIIGVTSTSTIDHKTAIHNAYEATKLINFKGKDYRKDIGNNVLRGLTCKS